MRDNICTIPVSEVFEPKDGCPFCRMRNMLEQRMTEYILGPAMMEPDVRQKTNELGFCRCHLEQMMQKKNRLPLALTLKTHLDYISKNIGNAKKPNAKKSAYKLSRIEESCFVCDRVEWGMERLIATFFKTYAEQYDFRQLFKEQEFICLPHYRMITELSVKQLDKKRVTAFSADCVELFERYLNGLKGDVEKFTQMFDYRADKESDEFKTAKDSIERAYGWLTSR